MGDEDAPPPPGGQENSLINTVGSGDNPQWGNDGPSTQVVALELQAGLPGPLCQRRCVSTHDAGAGASPQAAGCRGRGSGGAGASREGCGQVT